MNCPRKRIINQVERLAEGAFADHVAEQKIYDGVFRHFYCAKPETGNYAFNVTTIPGRIIVTGDIGELMVERCKDMFEWVPGALGSIDYFASKVPSSMPTKEYDKDIADNWLQEQQTAEGTESERAEKASELEWLTENPHEFYAELHSSGLIDGCDWPDFNNWKPGFLWCREALKWFFANYQTK